MSHVTPLDPLPKVPAADDNDGPLSPVMGVPRMASVTEAASAEVSDKPSQGNSKDEK